MPNWYPDNLVLLWEMLQPSLHQLFSYHQMCSWKCIKMAVTIWLKQKTPSTFQIILVFIDNKVLFLCPKIISIINWLVSYIWRGWSISWVSLYPLAKLVNILYLNCLYFSKGRKYFSNGYCKKNIQNIKHWSQNPYFHYIIMLSTAALAYDNYVWYVSWHTTQTLLEITMSSL